MAQRKHWLGADRDRARRAFVAENGDDLVGVVLAGPDPDDERRRQIARLYAAPEHWGEGIGRQLYDAAIVRDDGGVAVTDNEINELLAILDRGRQAWIDGQLGFGPGLDAALDEPARVALTSPSGGTHD